jgi:hypothetical protein
MKTFAYTENEDFCFVLKLHFYWAWGCSSIEKHLPNMQEDLVLTTSTEKTILKINTYVCSVSYKNTFTWK